LKPEWREGQRTETVETPYRIAIIEDSPENALIFRVTAQRAVAAEVEVHGDGLKGLEACLRDCPDLVITDLDLPSLRGEEICRLLRSSPTHREVPVIVCSGMDDSQRREMELLGIGANRYFAKPVDPRVLGGEIARLLQGRTPTPARAFAGPGAAPAPAPPAAAPPGTPLPTQLFAGYQVEEILGTGGMGTVYRAIQTSLGRPVALKVLLKATAESSPHVRRFYREAQLMAALNHPNIVRIYDMGSTDHCLYIAMEFVEGQALSRLVADQVLSYEQCLEVMRQAFDAVTYLHDHGVVHRDIKPANFLVSEEGLVKLTDFGISRADGIFPDIKVTQERVVVGTPAFMAPEHAMGSPATPLSDQYSLARTFQNLFESGEPEVMPRPLHETRPDLPRALSDALARCMDMNPSRRYPDIRAARNAVLAAGEIPG
jgi:CheY-like chemotaxis protein